MLSKYKARAAGGRGRRPSQGAWQRLFPFPDKYFGVRRAIQAAIVSRARVFLPLRGQPLSRDVLNERSSAKTPLIREVRVGAKCSATELKPIKFGDELVERSLKRFIRSNQAPPVACHRSVRRCVNCVIRFASVPVLERACSVLALNPKTYSRL